MSRPGRKKSGGPAPALPGACRVVQRDEPEFFSFLQRRILERKGRGERGIVERTILFSCHITGKEYTPVTFVQGLFSAPRTGSVATILLMENVMNRIA